MLGGRVKDRNGAIDFCFHHRLMVLVTDLHDQVVSPAVRPLITGDSHQHSNGVDLRFMDTSVLCTLGVRGVGTAILDIKIV